MKLKLLKISPGATHQGTVFQYYLDIELPISKRREEILWAYPEQGGNIKSMLGKTIDSELSMLVAGIFSIEDCKEKLMDPSSVFKGTYISRIDIHSLFTNPTITPKPLHNHLTYHGLETMDGVFLFGTPPRSAEVARDGATICIKYGLIELFTWNPA